MQARTLPELSLEERDMLPVWMKEIRECLHCPRPYRELDNMGRMNCFLHPGILVYDREVHISAYSCCGASIHGSIGCMASDHIPLSSSLPLLCQEERDKALSQFSLAVVPTVYFHYGMKPPLQKTILRREPSQLPDSLTFQPSFSSTSSVGPTISLSISEERKKLEGLIKKDSAEKLIDQNSGTKFLLKKRLDSGWRRSLADEYQSDDSLEDIPESAKGGKMENIDMSFVIIKRIDC